MGLVLTLAACGGSDTPPQDTVVDSSQVAKGAEDARIVQLGGRNFSIPSPVQAAYAIRGAGLNYNAALLAGTDKAGAITERPRRSLFLGMLGADMAYVTVHGDGQKALATLQTIERVGSELELSNAFDRALIERFKSNLGSEDSLLRFSGVAFRAADQYLKDNDRMDVSTYVLAGGWLESLHLTVSDPAAADNAELMARIGEQRRSLDDLVALIGSLPADEQDLRLLEGLKALQVTFSGITSTYTYEAPVTEVAKRTTYINSKTGVTITSEQFARIATQVSELRSMILA
ncbi:MAG: hypothetical protein R2817_04355 [Flavobacteriales bacterium]